jgi:hypothetical protein
MHLAGTCVTSQILPESASLGGPANSRTKTPVEFANIFVELLVIAE